MTWLLDTHGLIWALTGDPRLSGPARAIIDDRSARVLVSAVSAWEVALKVSIGRLRIPVVPDRLLEVVTGPMGMEAIPIEFSHALAAGSLPPIHRDPFDRLLIAQALSIGATIVTGDRDIPRYGVPTVW